MIPRAFITAWKQTAPWISDAQVEQDLVISRSLIELFSDDLLANTLAFRGGTALHKLYFAPAPRYSEDMEIDRTPVTDKQLRLNLEEKLVHPDFLTDIGNLLRPEIEFKPNGLNLDFLWGEK